MAADWETLAAQELERLPEPHGAKKRATVIALVDARIAGKSEETVWDRGDTCSRNTYHSKWKKDDVFADVLDKVTTMATGWHSGRATRALTDAAERLALASPVAVARAVEVLSSGKITFRDRDGEITSAVDAAMPDITRVLFGILDRAGLETAAKGTTEVTGISLDEWRKQQAERQQKASQALDDFAGIETDETE